MLLGIQGEEGLDGGVSQEPEENREEQAQGALIRIAEGFLQAGEHPRLRLGRFVNFRLLDEDEYQQSGRITSADPIQKGKAGLSS